MDLALRASNWVSTLGKAVFQINFDFVWIIINTFYADIFVSYLKKHSHTGFESECIAF